MIRPISPEVREVLTVILVRSGIQEGPKVLLLLLLIKLAVGNCSKGKGKVVPVLNLLSTTP
jgi:hypothetical protein